MMKTNNETVKLQRTDSNISTSDKDTKKDLMIYFGKDQIALIEKKHKCIIRKLDESDIIDVAETFGVSDEEIELYEQKKEKYTSKTDYSSIIPNYVLATDSTTEYFNEKMLCLKKSKCDENKYLLMDVKVGTSFYKGTPYFETDLMGSQYYWFGNEGIACEYAQRYQGGLIVMTNVQKLKLFVINKDNIKLIYDTITNDDVRNAFDLKYGIGWHYVEQISAILKYAGWNNDIWLYNERSIKTHFKGKKPNKWRLYGAGMNDRIVHNYIYEWLSTYFPEVDGTIIEKYFSPFSPLFGEEITLRYPNPKLKIDTTNKYHWRNWISRTNLQLPQNFHLNIDYRSANLKWNVIKYFDKYGNKKFSFSKPTYDFSMCTYNVHYLQSPNLMTSTVECLQKLIDMILQSQFDVWILQEFPAVHLTDVIQMVSQLYVVINASNGSFFTQVQNGKELLLVCMIKKTHAFKYSIIDYYTKKYRNSILIELKSKIALKIVATHIENGKRYVSRDGGFLQIDDFLQCYRTNIKTREKQLAKLLDNDPDIIAGDFNFLPQDNEAQMLHNYDIKSQTQKIQETNVYGSISDYIIAHKNLSYTTEHKYIPYGESDHIPVVCFFYKKY